MRTMIALPAVLLILAAAVSACAPVDQAATRALAVCDALDRETATVDAAALGTVDPGAVEDIREDRRAACNSLRLAQLLSGVVTPAGSIPKSSIEPDQSTE